MRTLFRLSFRNVMRNRRRTLLTTLLIGVGLAALILTEGFVYGMIGSMIRSVTKTTLGHGQIHRIGFREQNDIELTIKNWPQVKKNLTEDDRIQAFGPRTVSVGMISSSQGIETALVYGIDPASEAKFTQIKRAVVKGEYLSANGDSQEILLGAILADRLEVDLGDRIVVTLTQAKTGEIAQELFRVSGITQFNARSMDSSFVFIPLKRAQAALNLVGKVHEIAISLRSPPSDPNAVSPVWKDYDTEENEAKNWAGLMPALKSVIAMSGSSTMIMGIALFIVIVFGVVNSLFMAIFERLYELGVLRALGTRPNHIAAMVLIESGIIGAFSVLFGLALGLTVNGLFAIYGIDFGGMEYAGASLTEPIRTAWSTTQWTVLPAVVWISTVVAGLYPARYAMKIIPTVAMREHKA